MSEQVLYDADGITITTKRFVTKTSVYQLSNVASISSHKVLPSLTPSILFFSLSTCSLLAAIAQDAFADGLIYWIGFVALMICGVLLVKTRKPSWCLRLATSSGQLNAYITRDQKQFGEIYRSLQEAMVLDE